MKMVAWNATWGGKAASGRRANDTGMIERRKKKLLMRRAERLGIYRQKPSPRLLSSALILGRPPRPRTSRVEDHCPSVAHKVVFFYQLALRARCNRRHGQLESRRCRSRSRPLLSLLHMTLMIALLYQIAKSHLSQMV